MVQTCDGVWERWGCRGPHQQNCAAMRGYWAPAPDASKPIHVELPVDLIWGELDRYLRKELAVIPKAIAPNAVVKRLPHVCLLSWIPKILATNPFLN